MVIVLIVCILAAGISLDALQIWMKRRVNENLPEDRRLSWWSRNYRQVERIYEERHPESILPGLSRYGGYLVLALLAAAVLVSLVLLSYD
jgi:uncharacterized iron-regulated membrane protein